MSSSRLPTTAVPQSNTTSEFSSISAAVVLLLLSFREHHGLRDPYRSRVQVVWVRVWVGGLGQVFFSLSPSLRRRRLLQHDSLVSSFEVQVQHLQFDRITPAGAGLRCNQLPCLGQVHVGAGVRCPCRLSGFEPTRTRPQLPPVSGCRT
jgi:hypothetical protein